jgi:thiaminase/transcriptional activator TenA
MSARFSESLRSQARPIWRAIERHPFLVELQAGTLPLERFTYFILQDYLYLLDFAQVLCVAAGKADDFPTLELLARHALLAVEVERDFHAGFGKTLGLSPRELEKTPKAPVTEAYTRHLQAIGRRGSLGEVTAALLPCYWIYGLVGKRLRRGGARKPAVYRKWVETYASEAYWKAVREQIRLVDRLGKEAGPRERRLMRHHFLLSSRYEYLFWDQAYRLERWPV